MLEEILSIPLTEFHVEGNVFSVEPPMCAPPADLSSKTGFYRKIRSKLRPIRIFLLAKKHSFTNMFSPITNVNNKKRNDYYERLLADATLAKRFVSHYFSGVEMRENDIILDYGCGKGRALAALSRLGYKNLIGQDIILNDYWKRIPGSFLHIPLGCENPCPYKDESIDILLNFMMIQTVPPDLLSQHLREMIRIVKKGGYYIILERNPHAAARKHFETLADPYVHDLDAIQELLENEGFEIFDVSHEVLYMSFKPFRINEIRNFIKPTAKYDIMDIEPKTFFDSMLYKMLPEEKRGLRLIKARKK